MKKIKKILLICVILAACLLQGCISTTRADWVVINNSGTDIEFFERRDMCITLKNGESHRVSSMYMNIGGHIGDYIFEDIHAEIGEVRIKYVDSGTGFIYNYDGRYEPGHQFFNKRNWEGRTWKDGDGANYEWFYKIKSEDIQGN